MVIGLSKVRANLVCNHPYEPVAQGLSSFVSPPHPFAPSEGAAIKDPGNEVGSPICYASINVKPQGRGGGGRATHGKLTRRAFPWVEILTVGFCPGVGNLT